MFSLETEDPLFNWAFVVRVLRELAKFHEILFHKKEVEYLRSKCDRTAFVFCLLEPGVLLLFRLKFID